MIMAFQKLINKIKKNGKLFSFQKLDNKEGVKSTRCSCFVHENNVIVRGQCLNSDSSKKTKVLVMDGFTKKLIGENYN